MALEASASIYKPLPPNSIRVLTLEPGRKGSEFRCTLAEIPLHSKDGPTYEALSYMWGPPEPTNTITLNGQQHVVRANLFAALNRLRHEKDSRLLWIDALCINQLDISERSSQVAFMSSIYREARNVVAWLGEPKGVEVAALFALYRKEWFKLAKLLANSRWEALKSGGMPKFPRKEARRAISNNPYWRRVWIIQEILSASSVTLLCGSNRLSIDNWPPAQEYKEDFPGNHIIREYHERRSGNLKNSATLENLVYLCFVCSSECEDRRDKIYGILSLADDTADIVPDYTKSNLHLFFDFVTSDSVGRRANLFIRQLLMPYSQINFDLNDRLLPANVLPAILAQLQNFTRPGAKSMRMQASKVLVDFQSGYTNDIGWNSKGIVLPAGVILRSSSERMESCTCGHNQLGHAFSNKVEALYQQNRKKHQLPGPHNCNWDESLRVSQDHLLDMPTFDGLNNCNYIEDFIAHDGTLGFTLGDDLLWNDRWMHPGDLICHVEGTTDFHVIVRKQGTGYTFIRIAIIHEGAIKNGEALHNVQA